MKTNRSSFLHRFTAVLAVTLILVLNVLAVCPTAHEFFHHDADHEDHDCVVTQFHHGSTTLLDFSSLVVEPVLVSKDEPHVVVAVVLPAEPSFFHPPGCGPPAV